MPILVAGLSHRTSPVELRERFAFAESVVPEVLERMRLRGLAEEAVIVSTCNRVEIYACSTADPTSALEGLHRYLIEHGNLGNSQTEGIYSLAEPQSIEHLFKVVSGLDSMVLGETEILGQVKRAYELALKHRHTGPRLNRIFQRAFNVAKHIRTETLIQRGSVSVASVAVDLAEKIFDRLSGRTVLVLGAGDTSEKAARALLSRGAGQLLVSNRTFERAELLAKELNGQALHFEQWPEAAESADILVSSTAASGFVIDRARLDPLMKRRRYRTLLLVDLAVPRDIDPEVEQLENVYLYNVDDLQTIADDSMQQRREEIERCEAIIRERAAAVLVDPRRHPWSRAVRQTADSGV